ncbi:hypothetical protein BHE74_00018221 [Ensete ventricosum]|nr:hypothetical protein BHE74_00018221 [Ensete ventricosum]RZS16753.1 hypothetical protein BHM03_00048790 [Ensete ventricosum]
MIVNQSGSPDRTNALQKSSKSALSSDEHEGSTERPQRLVEVLERLLQPPPRDSPREELPFFTRTPYENREDTTILGGGRQGRVVLNPQVPPEPNYGLGLASHDGNNLKLKPWQERQKM